MTSVRRETNHLHKIYRLALAVAAILILVGCGDSNGGPTGPTSPVVTPGPQFPQVGGNWRGTWSGRGRPSQATLSLQQSDDVLRGTLTIGRVQNSVFGNVDAFGIVRLQGQNTAGICEVFFTDGNHLGLSDGNQELSGSLRYNSGTCGGRIFSQGGRLQLDKVL